MVAAAQQDLAEEGTMVITFKRYLDDLELIERRKREEEQRDIPTLEEVAAAAGVHPVTLSKIVNNQVKRLSLDIPARIISFMRERGFSMQTTDFIDYREL
jgi:hypothetical protein